MSNLHYTNNTILGAELTLGESNEKPVLIDEDCISTGLTYQEFMSTSDYCKSHGLKGSDGQKGDDMYFPYNTSNLDELLLRSLIKFGLRGQNDLLEPYKLTKAQGLEARVNNIKVNKAYVSN